MNPTTQRTASIVRELTDSRWFAAAVLVICLGLMSWQASAEPAPRSAVPSGPTSQVGQVLKDTDNAAAVRKPAPRLERSRLLALMAILAAGGAERR